MEKYLTVVRPDLLSATKRHWLTFLSSQIPDFWMHPEHLEAPDEALLDNADAVPPPFTEAKPAAS